MGNSYEYLITSLPFLQFNVSPGLNLDQLNSRVSENISKKNFESYQQVDFWNLDVCPTSTISALRDFKSQLQNEIIEIRKNRATDSKVTTSILPDEFKKLNPLEAESEINRLLWAKMEELAFGHNFDLSEVLMYKMRLQLLIRQFRFDAETGMEKVKNIILSQKNREE